MELLTLNEAQANFSEVVEKALAGEEIIVTRIGKPAVKVVCYEQPPQPANKLPLLGLMQGQGSLFRPLLKISQAIDID